MKGGTGKGQREKEEGHNGGGQGQRKNERGHRRLKSKAGGGGGDTANEVVGT